MCEGQPVCRCACQMQVDCMPASADRNSWDHSGYLHIYGITHQQLSPAVSGCTLLVTCTALYAAAVRPQSAMSWLCTLPCPHPT